MGRSEFRMIPELEALWVEIKSSKSNFMMLLYTSVVRMIKKHDSIVCNKIARSLFSGNPKLFWDNFKKIKSNSSIIPNCLWTCLHHMFIVKGHAQV